MTGAPQVEGSFSVQPKVQAAVNGLFCYQDTLSIFQFLSLSDPLSLSLSVFSPLSGIKQSGDAGSVLKTTAGLVLLRSLAYQFLVSRCFFLSRFFCTENKITAVVFC